MNMLSKNKVFLFKKELLYVHKTGSKLLNNERISSYGETCLIAINVHYVY